MDGGWVIDPQAQDDVGVEPILVLLCTCLEWV